MSNHFSRCAALAAAVAAALASQAAYAAPAVHTFFNYGGGNGSLDGLSNSSDIGLAPGGWSTGAELNFSPVVPTSQSYVSTGLTFGTDLLPAGGNAATVSVAPAGNTVAQDYSTHQLSATLTGTVYGSYLYQPVTLTGGRNYAGIGIGSAGAGDGNADFYVGGADFNSFNTPGYGEINIGGDSQTLAGIPMSTGTTYIVLFEFDNVGSPSAGRTGTAWILSQAQFNFRVAGNTLTPSTLSGVGAGTASGQVTQHGTVTNFGSLAGITPNSYLTISSTTDSTSAGASGTTNAQFDEFSLSTTTLADVTGARLGGDANRDGIVNISDLNIVAANWQKNLSGIPQGDFNGDGIVNIADLNILAANWQAGGVGKGIEDLTPSLAVLPVPEPSALPILLFLPALLLLKRRSGTPFA